MTAFVRAHRASNPEAEVYGLGYSNGANILAAVLFEAPELFDRAVLMHPLIPWRPAPQPALLSRSVLITAGRQDPICPLPQTEALMAYFEGEGARVELSLHDGGHEIWPEEISAVREFLRRQHGRTAAGQYNQYQGS